MPFPWSDRPPHTSFHPSGSNGDYWSCSTPFQVNCAWNEVHTLKHTCIGKALFIYIREGTRVRWTANIQFASDSILLKKLLSAEVCFDRGWTRFKQTSATFLVCREACFAKAMQRYQQWFHLIAKRNLSLMSDNSSTFNSSPAKFRGSFFFQIGDTSKPGWNISAGVRWNLASPWPIFPLILTKQAPS